MPLDVDRSNHAHVSHPGGNLSRKAQVILLIWGQRESPALTYA